MLLLVALFATLVGVHAKAGVLSQDCSKAIYTMNTNDTSCTLPPKCATARRVSVRRVARLPIPAFARATRANGLSPAAQLQSRGLEAAGPGGGGSCASTPGDATRARLAAASRHRRARDPLC